MWCEATGRGKKCTIACLRIWLLMNVRQTYLSKIIYQFPNQYKILLPLCPRPPPLVGSCLAGLPFNPNVNELMSKCATCLVFALRSSSGKWVPSPHCDFTGSLSFCACHPLLCVLSTCSPLSVVQQAVERGVLTHQGLRSLGINEVCFLKVEVASVQEDPKKTFP